MIRGLFVGAASVVVALGVGLGIAVALVAGGLTETSWWLLGTWLAGLGLLGTWSAQVSSTVSAHWTVTASGVPLLVTGAVAAFIAWQSRDRKWVDCTGAALGAAGAASLLVALSHRTVTVANAAGSVTTVNVLTWRTPLGAAALVCGLWLLHTIGRAWWRSGRAVASATLVWLGGLVSIGIAAFLGYWTSSLAVACAAVLLYPLAGTVGLFAAAGVPVTAGLTRLTPGPFTIDAWGTSARYAIGGLLAVALLSALAGLVLRVRHHDATWLGALTVTPALAGFLAWAMSTSVQVPASFGASSLMRITPLACALVGLGMAALARASAGSPRRASDPTGAAQSDQAEPANQ